MTTINRIAPMLVALTILGCREENPYWDSTSWNMNQTVEQLANLLHAENVILAQAEQGHSLSEPLERELWALLLDECDTGFEVWVRLRRNRKLVAPFCDALSTRVASLMSEQLTNGTRLGWDRLDGFRSVAPSDDAWESLRPRLGAFGIAALLDRCSNPAGYRQRHWP